MPFIFEWTGDLMEQAVRNKERNMVEKFFILFPLVSTRIGKYMIPISELGRIRNQDTTL
jgi:hypothetical protein